MVKVLSDFELICRRERPRSGRKNTPCPQAIELQAASCGLTPVLATLTIAGNNIKTSKGYRWQTAEATGENKHFVLLLYFICRLL